MTTLLKSTGTADPAAIVSSYGPMTNSLVDLNNASGRFYYGSTRYNSLSAIVAAHGSTAGGVSQIAITLPSVYWLYAEGHTGAPAAAYLMSLNDGADAAPADNLLAISQGTDSAMSVLMLSNSVDQLASNLYQAGAGANNIDIAVAVRVKLNDMAASFNGGAAKTDTSATLPIGLINMVVANRDDAIRAWSGTWRRLVVGTGELNNAQLAALSA